MDTDTNSVISRREGAYIGTLPKMKQNVGIDTRDNPKTAQAEGVCADVISNTTQNKKAPTNYDSETPQKGAPNTDKYYEVLQQDRFFKVLGNHSVRKYPYFIYNSKGDVIESGEVDGIGGVSPEITYVTEDILEVKFHVGTGTYFCKYYHTSLDKLSANFENPFLLEDERIVYYDGESHKLIVQNVFDRSIFLWEYPIDISVTMWVDYTEFMENGTKLKIIYHRPSDNEIETRIFDIR